MEDRSSRRARTRVTQRPDEAIPVVQDIIQPDAAGKLAATATAELVTSTYWSTTQAAAGRCQWMRPTAIGMKPSR